MIEYDHRDQIPAYLLRLSHSARKFIEGRWPFMFQRVVPTDELIG
jgi:hypothetical protein